jgi:hypothetical protein
MGEDPRLQQLSELLPSVEPARALAVLGRCAIRVAIEEPRPARTAAHAVASSLERGDRDFAALG